MRISIIFIFIFTILFLIACAENSNVSVQNSQQINEENNLEKVDNEEEENNFEIGENDEEKNDQDSAIPEESVETITTIDMTFEEIELKNPLIFELQELSNYIPTLIGATDKHLVFLTLNNELAIYGIESENIVKIDDNVQYAIVSNDAKFVFYVREEGVYDILHYYDIELGIPRGSIYPENPLGGIIRSLAYTNGIVYHTYGLSDPNSPYRYESVPVKMIGHTDIVLEPEDEKLIKTSNALAANSNHIYYYSLENKSINRVNLLGPNEEISKVDYPLERPHFMVVNDNEAWAMLDEREDPAYYNIVTSFGVIENVFNVQQMDWLYGDYLIFTAGDYEHKLFVINPETMEVKELVNGISTFNIFGNKLYGQMSDGSTMIVFELPQ